MRDAHTVIQCPKMNGEYAPFTSMPLQFSRPGENEESTHDTAMAIVPDTLPTTTSPPFKLPADWVVEMRSRTSGNSAGVIDKYYHEPETGRCFRSLRAVEIYLRGAKETNTSQASKPSKRTLMLRWLEKEVLHHKREMAFVLPTTTSRFKLPNDWIVKRKIRSSGNSVGRIDKYYYEPGTGRQFRSLRDVEKYLMEINEDTPLCKMLMADSKEHHKLNIVASHTARTTSFKLPADWVVKDFPRSNLKYSGRTDKYYYEPETGRQFRSLISVERYLTGTSAPKCLQNSASQKIISNYESSENSGSQNKIIPSSKKKTISSHEAKTSSFDLGKPPLKIRWVLQGPGDAWCPLMGGLMVPDSEKQQWAKIFVSTVKYRNSNAPSCIVIGD